MSLSVYQGRKNKMKNNKFAKMLLMLLCGIPACTTFATSLENETAIKILLEKADYWHGKSNYELAYDALNKIFAIEPNNIEALYLMSCYKIQQGNKQDATSWIERFKKFSPNDQRIRQLMQFDPQKNTSDTLLKKARSLAQKGQIDQAIQAYNNLFINNPPSGDLAIEYYETLAGSKNHLELAISELRKKALQSPSDSKVQLVLATVLTYQEKTRREGIQKLSQLDNKNTAVINALQQALLWLQPNESDLPLYQNFINLSPNDNRVMEHYNRSVGGNEILAAFTLLNKGRIEQAKQKFTTALENDPKNSDAMAGLGYVALHQKDYQQAEIRLREAANSTDNHKRKQWLKDLESIGYYSSLDTIKKLTRDKQYDQAFAYIDQTTAYSSQQQLTLDLLRGQIYRDQKNYTSAESLYQKLNQKYPNNKLIKEQLVWLFAEQKKYAELNQLFATLPVSERHYYQQRIDMSEQYRKEAQQALDNGLDNQAETILKQAIDKNPNNAWLNLDYARVLNKKGEKQKAAAVINNLVTNYPSTAAWHSALIFASEQNNWSNVLTLSNKIPPEAQSSEIIELKQRAKFNQQVDIAKHYIENGNNNAALNTLKINIKVPPNNPSDIGRLAQLYMDAGDNQMALKLIRQNQLSEPQGNLSDYGQQILVLRRLGYIAEAESLMNSPALLATANEKEINNIRATYLSEQADLYHEKGHLNEAWQILAPELKNNPNNSLLLLATGRIYQANGQSNQAADIYHYVLSISPQNQDALMGLVDIALANKEISTVKKYFNQIPASNRTSYIMLSARVAKLEGNNTQAIKLLKTAQWGLINPTENSSDFPINHPLAGEVLENTNQSTQQKQQLNYIEIMLNELQQKTAIALDNTIEFNSHSGESGLSKLTEFKDTVSLSIPVSEDMKIALNISPSVIDSGKTPAENASLVGSGALIRANRRSLVDSSLRENIHADEIGSNTLQGLESSISLKSDNFQLDFGHTNSDALIVSLVGGAKWSFNTTPNSQLTFNAERRAVKDSLLSYGGLKDSVSGKEWGAVTRNTLSAQYAWDDSHYGAYAKIAGNKYIGSNIQTNQSIDFNTGTYIYGINKNDKKLTLGANVHYMAFDKNLNYYTLGHAGYFSPQRYIAFSLPISYQQDINNLSIKLSSNIGYQSYTTESTDYYPNNPQYQKELENYALNDEYIDTRYKNTSKNGISYAISVDTKYKISPSSLIGANVSYNTFGNYDETKANIYFKYLFDNDILGK